jgi:predicted nucleic acid-binding protein
MIYVYDSSFFAALVIPDEKIFKEEKLRTHVNEDDEIFVPQLFWYEITNVFNNLVLRKRFKVNEVISLYPRLEAVNIIVDNTTGPDYSKKLLGFCGEYKLSSYDAAYLELAERKKAVLCTLDGALKAAAKKCGVAVLK